MKNPLTPAGIEPATFRFVAQHLNHCATAVPTILCETFFILRRTGWNMIENVRLHVECQLFLSDVNES